MAVRLRLKRFGRRNHPTYRLTATDGANPRDGQVLEELGSYDPVNKDPDKQLDVKKDRVEYWLSVGARPSDTVRNLLKKSGITVTTQGR